MKQYKYNERPAIFVNGSNQTDLEDFIDTAWNFTLTALWNTSVFSNREINEAKKKIRFYFLKSGDLRKAYSVFCQRVLLARQYLSNNSNRFIPLPSVWLNAENEKGFTGTASWYQDVYEARQSLPFYKIELKALAEAVWELSQEPTQNNFHYWKNYFIDRKTPGLLSLFLNIVANQQFR